jgi:hypothetical protein
MYIPVQYTHNFVPLQRQSVTQQQQQQQQQQPEDELPAETDAEL